jgi:glycosyltransferase involved in cell wall biosynthesis
MALRAVVRALLAGAGRRSGIAISVVMTTCNRASYLDLTLGALDRQLFPPEAWELILVDPGSRDGTGSLTAAWQAKGRLPLSRIAASPLAGRAAMLNEALARAKGGIVLFLGDDQLAKPDLLAQHLFLHLRGPRAVLGNDGQAIHSHVAALDEVEQPGISASPHLGVEDLDDLRRLSSFILPAAGGGAVLAYLTEKGSPIPFPWAHFSVAHASVPRSVIVEAGGFDERFHGWGLEEVDLAFRMHWAGLEFAYGGSAVTLRQIRQSQTGRARSLESNLGHLFAKHPHMTHPDRALILNRPYSALE